MYSWNFSQDPCSQGSHANPRQMLNVLAGAGLPSGRFPSGANTIPS